jgi:ParB family chromosome partitioning protein
MTETITIPLNRLNLWDGNVRKTGVNDGIGELAASISAHGLLQSLVVRKTKRKRSRYEIVAGQRRFLALQALAKDAIIANDFAVPCMLAADSVDASELSLAENVVRAPMHPADQFEAFRMLIDDGETVTDVAARFGVSELVVTKRMKLGRLSPVVIEAYRNGDIDLEAAQAFAITDDRDAQERVFASLSDWNREAHNIRRALTENDIATSDKRVRFIGIEVYRDAGGHIRQDLFCDEGTGYIEDAELLERLIAEKLGSIACEVRTEGWNWVDTAIEADYQALSVFVRRHPVSLPLDAGDQVEFDRLSSEYDELVDQDDADSDRLSEIESRLDVLNDRAVTWPEDTLAIGGCIVSIGYDGNPRVERGLVRKADARAVAALASVAGPEVGAGKGMVLPASLVEDLTSQRTAAIAAELIGRPDIALAAIVHALTLSACYTGQGDHTCVKLSARNPLLKSAISKPENCKGFVVVEQERRELADCIPGNPADLWDWCLSMSREGLLDILAFHAASAVNAVQSRNDRPGSPRFVHADALSSALGIDMTNWFTPTAENYFGRISRSRIIAAIDEAKGDHAPALDKLKKGDLATRAEQLLAGTGWLPDHLRGTTASSEESDVA